MLRDAGERAVREYRTDERFPCADPGNGVNMQKKILNFIAEHRMLERGDRLVIGVSGGADSVCLLRLLCSYRASHELKLYAVHVNHGLRGEEAARDEKFVRELCNRLEVPCRVVSVDIREEAKRLHLSEEEAGRERRYRSFAEEAEKRGCTKIAVAHHMEDNAETLLFRMFRGTGVTGLSGIAPVSPLGFAWREEFLQQNPEPAVIRPLLCVTRAEIEEYLRECGQEYCTDSTNEENDYSRNRIRNEILPVASGYINAQSVRNLNTLANHARAVTEYLQRQAEVLYERCVTAEENRLCIALQGAEEEVLLELVFRKCLYALAGKKRDISSVHIGALCGLCKKQVGSRLDLPYGICARRSYDGILLYTEAVEQAEPGMCNVRIEPWELAEGKTVELPGKSGCLRFCIKEMDAFGPDASAEIVKIARNDYTKCFDYDKIKDNISVRVPQEPDYLCIHPDGRKKLLKDYLVNAKVPQEERSSLHLVAEGNLVLWIPGKRTSENRRVSEKTKRVLMIEWIL